MGLMRSLLATPVGVCKVCNGAKCGDVTGGECNNRAAQSEQRISPPVVRPIYPALGTFYKS